MSDEGASQCGFCTPGFVVSLSGFCLSNNTPDYKNAIASIDGNICRCTGYKSIERAVAKVCEIMNERKIMDPIDYAIEMKMIPQYFKEIKQRLFTISSNTNGFSKNVNNKFLGGGTDLYVQQPENMVHEEIDFLYDNAALKGISIKNNQCKIGASATVSDILSSPVFHEYFPGIDKYIKLVSSTPIRNMATIAGNFINASPIGDFTIFFLALDAQLVISDGENERSMPLRKLYKGYKLLDKQIHEFIKEIYFELPAKNTFFNFEKVSKRTHLDIASVNTAMSITIENNSITDASISAGGVGPVPSYLAHASLFLKEKEISEDLIFETIKIVRDEISPISDARGSSKYKSLLLGQLIKAHFLTFFPELSVEKMLKN